MVLMAICLLTLTACGTGSDSDPEPTPTSEPTAEPTMEPTRGAATLPDVESPVWASGVSPDDGSPVESLETVPTDADVIYAVFRTSEISAGTSFSIAWTMNGTPVPGLNPTLEMRADAPAGWIEFHLDRTSPSNWPEGVLEIELRSGETVVSSGSVELRDP
jgi:hypothetical protein